MVQIQLNPNTRRTLLTVRLRLVALILRRAGGAPRGRFGTSRIEGAWAKKGLDVGYRPVGTGLDVMRHYAAFKD